MTKKEYKKVLKKAQKKTRKKDCSILAMEEISELVEEIQLWKSGNGSKDHVCEEIADVTIMIELVIGAFHLSRKQIDNFKKEYSKRFKEYSRNHDIYFNLDSTIFELLKLQKLICKKSRGRKDVKRKLVEAVGACELSFDYLISNETVDLSGVSAWRSKKVNRMDKRIHHGGIV